MHMKKIIYSFLVIAILITTFVAGFRYSQQGQAGKVSSGSRQILHYVDPMNPANTSKEPGIAPCGMPMEPVYADDPATFTGTGTNDTVAALAAVRVKQQTRQLLGVQVDQVVVSPQSYQIRALGRVVPDENKVYALIAGTDGWLGEVHQSTTGSLVNEGQLMAKIRILDYDFFTWQQRYLTELGNAGFREVYTSPRLSRLEQRQQELSRAEENQTAAAGPTPLQPAPETPAERVSPQPMAQHTKDAPPRETKPGDPLHGAIPPDALYYGSKPQGVPEQPEPVAEKHFLSFSTSRPSPTQQATPPNMTEADHEMHMGPPESGGTQAPVSQGHAPHASISSQTVEQKPTPAAQPDGFAGPPTQEAELLSISPRQSLYFTGQDDILYASRARQELMDLGVSNDQLMQLAQTGIYIRFIELRSPVDGLVLSRSITPLQKITRGDECFEVADLATVWVEADIYDQEATLIKPGTVASVRLPNQAARYTATVTEVLPEFDKTDRTLKIRLEMNNPHYRFRPDMFVDVTFQVDIAPALTVPTEAVIDAGIKQVVYVQVDDGVFQPRQVSTGRHLNERVEIVSGLHEGESVVISGTFLIDAESRIKLAALQLMDQPPEEGAEAAGAPNASATDGEEQAMPMQPVPRETSVTIDPICGMEVDPAVARAAGLFVEYEGETTYFCSAECAEDFQLSGPPESPARQTSFLEREAAHEQLHQMPSQPLPDADSANPQHDTAVDPICQMSVNTQAAEAADLFVDKDGVRYYFCSEMCKNSFAHEHDVVPDAVQPQMTGMADEEHTDD